MRERAGPHPALHLGNQFGIRERVGAPLNLNPVGRVFLRDIPRRNQSLDRRPAMGARERDDMRRLWRMAPLLPSREGGFTYPRTRGHLLLDGCAGHAYHVIPPIRHAEDCIACTQAMQLDKRDCVNATTLLRYLQHCISAPHRRNLLPL